MLGSTQQKAPVVSAVIPCRNERRHIEACVRSVLGQQAVPGEFEVIVIDGMSDDGTREILGRLAREDARLRVIDNPARATAPGMNLGIQHARGKFVAIMGAHNQYAPDYLAASLKVSRATGADNVGGSMVCRGETWVQQAVAAAHHSPFSVGGARWHNVAYEGLSALFRQYLQYGYWKVPVMTKHHRPASLRHIVPGAFVLSLAGLPLAALFHPPLIFLWLALLGAYSLANLGASIVTAARRGWRRLPVLPLVFACYHFGYGIGFVRGVCGFLILRRAPALSFSRLTRAS